MPIASTGSQPYPEFARSNSMRVPPEILSAISKAVKKNGQSPQFEARYRKFFENLATANDRESDLEDLIRAVETEDSEPDEEE